MAHEWDADHYAEAHPARADGKILPPYPRLFFIAAHA
jgi:trans-aconitate methyltransferase